MIAVEVDYCGTVKMSHKGIFLATLEKLTKEWTVGSYIVAKINPRVSADRTSCPLGKITIIEKSKDLLLPRGQEVINQVIAIYISSLIIILMLIYLPVSCNLMVVIYFNACNEIDNKNRMRQSELELAKYWVTQSGYFRLVIILEL